LSKLFIEIQADTAINQNFESLNIKTWDNLCFILNPELGIWFHFCFWNITSDLFDSGSKSSFWRFSETCCFFPWTPPETKKL